MEHSLSARPACLLVSGPWSVGIGLVEECETAGRCEWAILMAPELIGVKVAGWLVGSSKMK